jgi:hypothetical protein
VGNARAFLQTIRFVLFRPDRFAMEARKLAELDRRESRLFRRICILGCALIFGIGWKLIDWLTTDPATIPLYQLRPLYRIANLALAFAIPALILNVGVRVAWLLWLFPRPLGRSREQVSLVADYAAALVVVSPVALLVVGCVSAGIYRIFWGPDAGVEAYILVGCFFGFIAFALIWCYAASRITRYLALARRGRWVMFLLLFLPVWILWVGLYCYLVDSAAVSVIYRLWGHYPSLRSY